MRTTSFALRAVRDEATAGAAGAAVPDPCVAEPQATSQTCSYEVVTTRAAFDALAADWNELFARAGRSTQLFQSFGWNWHWCNHYLGRPGMPGPQLAVVTARCGDRLV